MADTNEEIPSIGKEEKIKEKETQVEEKSDGTITYQEQEQFNEKGLVQRYQNNWINRQMIDKQLQKIPQQKQELEAQIQLLDNFIEHVDDEMEKIKSNLESHNIAIDKKLEKIRKKYSEEQLMNMANQMHLNSEMEIQKDGDNFKFIKTFNNSVEDLLIYYTSLKHKRLDYLERKGKEQENLNKLENTKENQEKIINDIDETLDKIEKFVKRQGKDINKLLAKYGNSKSNKDVGEIK